MLIQHRRDGSVRLFRQHDHALLSGELASRWRGYEREADRLPFAVVFATALHDLAWRGLDRLPRLDPDTGVPLPFHAWPLESKLEAYRAGLDELSMIHPYAAILCSHHYCSFPDLWDAPDFLEEEAERRDELSRRLELNAEELAAVGRHLAYLQLFDNMSLFICLLPPSADATRQPPWVEACRHLPTPSEGAVHLTWVGDDVVHVDPYPFDDSVAVAIPYRELTQQSYPNQAALDDAWDAASPMRWWISVRSAPRLA